jgi:N-acetylated-alpha-linked acidic dipeptidase
MDYGQCRLINVVGKIAGSIAPDEWIIVGSHRDAWVFGASDSVSGHVSMMATARAFGQLVKNGWKPRRSILFVSWDGEEPGLLGSTEWVEDLTAELKAHAAIYVNRDAGAGGTTFTSSAVPSLTPFLYDIAKSIPTGTKSQTLYDTWLARTREQSPHDRVAPSKPTVGALGSGSDYTAFLDHVGIASADMGLTGVGGDGTYHSTYDHPGWFKKYIDPEFRYSVLATQATGVTLLRLASAEVLPLDYESYGSQIVEYATEIEKEANRMSPEKSRTVDFAGLVAAAIDFTKAGAKLRVRADAIVGKGGEAASAAALADLNRRLIMAERDLIEPAGLPDRPWFKHVIYAPGLYTGYGVKTIPGVREAIDAGNFPRAADQAAIVIRALNGAANTLE